MSKDTQSRSWFIVAPNILENGIAGLTEDAIKSMDYKSICEYVVNSWCINDNRHACACLYCKSKEEMEHLHIVCESKTPIKFSTIKNTFGSKVHVEETKGNKKQVEDYINKVGVFEEKDEQILAKETIGELIGKQGKRTDLEKAYEMIQDGKTPKEICRCNVNMFRFRNYIEEMYYMYRDDMTPTKRELKVILCNGESGTGKTHTAYYQQTIENGSSSVYKVSDYKHGFDRYSGEDILVLDEYRGNLPYHQLLTLLDCYKSDVPARYSNKLSLWNTVYISTVLPVEKLYKKMVDEADEGFDSIKQLLRRITEFRYHYIIHKQDGSCQYHYVTIDSETYTTWLQENKDTKEYMEVEAYRDAFEHGYNPNQDVLNFKKRPMHVH